MFDIEFNLYGFIIIISMLIGLIVIYFNVKKLNYLKEDIFFLIVYLLIGMIVGAKYFDYIINIERYKTFNFMSIGLSSYGAVIGVIVMLVIYSKQFKKSFLTILTSIIPSLPLIYGLSKIACFISGCCYGIEYDGLFSIVYYHSHSAPNGVGLFPVQLVESIIFILIFMLFNFKVKINDKYTGYMFIVCGFFKFILDFFRHTHMHQMISTNQIVSLLFIIIGIIYIYLKKIIKSR